MDLGQMVLVFEEALIARSSSKILFFKQEFDEDLQCTRWVLYDTLKIRGFIYFIRGNVRIQVTTADQIFFYLIDPETFVATLENVMYNYMGCNEMMIGSKVRYAITYKTNEKSFDIYQRKYMHNLRVCVDDQNFDGSKGLEIISSNIVLVTKVDKVLMYDCDTLQFCG
jgi:hypothetical protein